MKKVLASLIMIFLSVSSADAANFTLADANANAANAANAATRSLDPLKGDLKALLASGFTIDQILNNYATSNSPYAITEVIASLTEVADPKSYGQILAATNKYAPAFKAVIQQVIQLYRADLKALNSVNSINELAATAAGAGEAAPRSIAAASSLITRYNVANVVNTFAGSGVNRLGASAL